MQQKSFRFGPQIIDVAAQSILQPPVLTGGVLNGTTFPLASTTYNYAYVLLTHIRVVNTTTGNVTVSAAINPNPATITPATGFAWYASPIPATTQGTNWLDWYGRVRVDAGEYLNMVASVASAIAVEGEGELGIF